MPSTKKKTSKKSAPKPAAKPAQKSKDHSVTESALKLVDEAAALLRKGINTSSDATDTARREARKKAHSLLDKASESLSDLLEGSASVLRKVSKKID